jgi:hypothetical protein
VDREVIVAVSVGAVGYNHETSTFEIEFCDSSIYQYAPVSEEIYNGLMNSLGSNLEKTDLRYFSEHIKGKYKQKTIRRPRRNLFKHFRNVISRALISVVLKAIDRGE